jgi:hypothetical protein
VLSDRPKREHGLFMKALRWILFSLLAFGLGTGAALALHPPTIGIPTATASKLSGDLSAIRSAAAAGRCNDVQGRLTRAQSRINHLPDSVAMATVSQLQDSLEKVRKAAMSTCNSVANAAAAQDTPATTPDDTTDTTPASSPAAEDTTPEATTPPADTGGNDGGGVDPGSTEGDGTSTTSPGTGDGTGDGSGDQGTGGTALPGGASVPSGGAVRQQIDKAQRKIEQAQRKIEETRERLRKAWGQ